MVDAAAVLAVGTGPGRGEQLVGAGFNQAQHVGHRGVPVKALGEYVDRPPEDDLLGVVERLPAHQGAQRQQQRHTPAPNLESQLPGVGAAHAGECTTEGAGVQRVEPVQAAADPDDLPAEVLDESGVVGLGVAEDQRAGAEPGHASDESLDDRGLADAGLPEDEHAGVGDEAFA